MAVVNAGLGFHSPVASGGDAHVLDTTTNYTAGNLLKLQNNNVDKFVVRYDGAIDQDVTVTGDLTVSGAGPHAIGGVVTTNIGLAIRGSYTGSASTIFEGVRLRQALTAGNGQTTHIAHLGIATSGGSITTQGNTETITDVASVIVLEPNITVGTGDTVTNASTIKIVSAPTEGTNNRALWVAAGLTELAGDLQHSGTNLGLYSATPVAQPTTGIGEAAFVENGGGTAVNVDSTFGGYTLQQITQALQDIGALA